MAERAAGAVARHFDGLVSSRRSLVSAKLWDSGVKYALEDHQFTRRIHSLVSQLSGTSSRPRQQKMMTELWAQTSRPTAPNMAVRQTKARATLGSTASNSPIDRRPERRGTQKMMAEQDQVAKDIKVSPEMVRLIMAEAGSGS